MRLYPLFPSFLAGQEFTVCIEPEKRFSIALYRAGAKGLEKEEVSVVTHGPDIREVPSTHRGTVFDSVGPSASKTYEEDWKWPELTLKATSSESRAILVVAFEVDENGSAVEQIGRKIQSGQTLYPYPPDSDSMALLVAVPSKPTQNGIAYILPVATYHAYNGTGGGCFYGYPQVGIKQADVITLRRPGGGLGAKIGDPPDYYDEQSPRQQFAHWDYRFLLWMMRHGWKFDVFCDLDLSLKTPRFNMDEYKLIVSAGHHEYWSQPMRDNLKHFLETGGNYACFSGNTCYRPISFTGSAPRTSQYPTMVQKLGNSWPQNNEDSLIGLSFAFGGGRWGEWSEKEKRWINTERNPYGYTVQQEKHWVFDGTNLRNGENFGGGDHLVGYEADGVRPGSTAFTALATSEVLTGFVNEGGVAEPRAVLGLFGNDHSSGPSKAGLVFNAGTTDWARVLTTGDSRWRETLEVITANVLRTLSLRR